MSASEQQNKAFTERQAQAYEALPGTAEDIANDLGVSKSAARDHISALRRDCGVALSQDEYGIYYDRQNTRELHTTAGWDEPSEDTSKAQHTIKKKEVLLELKRSLARELQDKGAVVAENEPVTNSDEDVVIHRSDDHIGAKYTNEFGNLTYGPETSEDRVREVTNKTMELVTRQREAGITFDTAHLIMGGDTVHGEGIHGNQPWESAMTLIEQIKLAHELYVEQIERLRAEFNEVQVICQNGNHGELRGDGMSEDANADDIVYMMLENTAHDRGWDDVTVIRSEAGNYTNFTMRGHSAHVRHGQNSLLHIGTSSGKKRWYHWLQQHDFDIAYRGHYHEFRIENISSKPVIMSGSICPPDDFEESLAVWSEPAATVHGVSDERPMTWMFPVDFHDSEADALDPEPTAQAAD